MPMILPRDALVHINGNRLSDHGRGEVERSPERIGSSVRTARGRLKKNHVADKWSFSLTWSRLPERDTKTIDGFWGAQSIINFYNATSGEFTLSLVNSDGTTNDYTVVFESFSYTVLYRYEEYYYDISFDVVEV